MRSISWLSRNITERRVTLEYRGRDQQNMRGQRDTEGVGCHMTYTLKLFSVSENLFFETSAQITTSI